MHWKNRIFLRTLLDQPRQLFWQSNIVELNAYMASSVKAAASAAAADDDDDE